MSAVCSPMLGPATAIPVTATAGTGSMTAHWTDLSDPSVLTYRIAAIPNYGAPTTWLTVAATHTCKTLTTTITGLSKGMNYEIWVDAVHTDTTYGTSNITRETMIGRSLAVTVL
ncbi:fibronectin type III domain-containing protein [Actinoplanes sp. HUAS TT8]|uniref:fibronectin type III domain-containing protein n=1 Tax=Actinoplanes sp. HUAS TT8 TaxID=3447453 RepID=UPI003F51BABD